MAISPLIRPLGITAAVLATCQGLAWTVLTLMGILIFTRAWPLDVLDLTSIQFWIYGLFLTDPGDDSDTMGLLMIGDTMLGFMSVYFGLSLIWMIASLSMLWVVIREKWVYGKCTFIFWGILTGIISILDIVAMGLFASDFYTMNNYYKDDVFDIFPYSAVSAVGIMMTVAARGFVLLIANAVFAIIFTLWGCTIDENISKEEPKREFINGFQQEQRPAWLSNGDTNNGFARPYSNSAYENEQPQTRINSLNQNRNTSPHQPDSFGKLGRSNLKPYQNQQNQERGPYIPAPDYSPPSLQKHPKSVLKSRSHY